MRERNEHFVATGEVEDDLVRARLRVGHVDFRRVAGEAGISRSATVTDSSSLPGLRRGMTSALSSWMYAMAAAIGWFPSFGSSGSPRIPVSP